MPDLEPSTISTPACEVVYVLINEAMPGLVKIGRTNGDLSQRIRQLFGVGVPLPFSLFFACEVKSGAFVESRLHDAFGDHRVSRSREFFRIAPERVKAALEIAMIREITLGDEVYETPVDKEDVEAARKRSRFRLSTINLPVGSELRLARDPNITCKTFDDVNKVIFDGAVRSLSNAAVLACRSIGAEATSLSGPWEWMFEGERLDDIRRELEDGVTTGD